MRSKTVPGPDTANVTHCRQCLRSRAAAVVVVEIPQTPEDDTEALELRV